MRRRSATDNASFGRNIGQKADKFFAAQAGQQVRWSQLFFGEPTKINQHLVPGRVPVFVIDSFEVVKVAQEECDRPLVSDTAQHDPLALFNKGSTVVDPR